MKKQLGFLGKNNLHLDFWKSLGLEILEIPESLQTDLKRIQSQSPSLVGCAMDLRLGEMFFATASVIAEEVREAGMCDSVIFDGKKQWLRCFLRDSLKELLVRKAQALDTHAQVYVTGSGPLSRMCAVVAIGLGFKKINWVAADESAAQDSIVKLKKLFFDIEVKYIHESELTLQPSNGSLLINTVDAEDGSILLEDLTFLNFLKEASVVVNLPLQLESALLHEAEGLNIVGIDGAEVWGLRDYFFLRQALQNDFTLDEETYLSSWRDFLKKQDHGPVTKEPAES